MCIEDTTLIRLLRGELPAEQCAQVQQHLEECPLCQQRLAALSEAWDALGRWAVQPPDAIQFAERMHRAVRQEAAKRGCGLRRFVLRAAAAVLLAAGAGVAAALLVAKPQVSYLPPEDAPETLVDTLGLDVLSEESGASLAQLFADENDTRFPEGPL